MNRMEKFNNKERQDEDFYKAHYGPGVVLTRLGMITLVHLDNPSSAVIQRRTNEVLREEISGEAWDDNCPLCETFRNQPHDIVYPAV